MHSVFNLHTVVVDDPWPTPFLLVPQGSSVRMTCRADRNSPTIFWSIDLAIDTSTVQYQFPNGATTLNNAGVYELPREKNATTLGLLINDTAKNNGTVIHCNRGLMSTLLVLGKSSILF